MEHIKSAEQHKKKNVFSPSSSEEDFISPAPEIILKTEHPGVLPRLVGTKYKRGCRSVFDRYLILE